MLTRMAENQAKPRATYQDLLAVDDRLVAEIVDGELFTSPRPAPRHAVSTVELATLLVPVYGARHRRGPGGWLILIEPEIHLGEDIVVPDLAGWRQSDVTLPREAYFSKAPDWLCEVLSPSTRRLDRLKKLRVYAREGVAHVWLVDPDDRSVEVLRLEAGQWVVATIVGGDDRVRPDPFAEVDLDLTTLWAD